MGSTRINEEKERYKKERNVRRAKKRKRIEAQRANDGLVGDEEQNGK